MRFEFATTGRILFGEGTREEISGIASAMGGRALIATAIDSDRVQHIFDTLLGAGVQMNTFQVDSEPSVESVARAAETACDSSCNMVIALGGGSAIDTGKAVAALVANGGEPLDYLEVVGRGQALVRPSMPMIAVPTTAGTGAEVTRNAVLAAPLTSSGATKYVPEHKVKVSLRSPYMLPDVAVIDPELTYTMPPSVTASTGLDALTQCLEPYVSILANPLTDAIAREGIQRAARSLRRAYLDDLDRAARRDMCLSSLFGGLALANAKLGAVHGLAGVLGGMFPIPHGVVCARLLPFVMEANVRALQMRAPDSPLIPRFDEVAQLLTGKSSSQAADGVLWIQKLCEALDVPALGTFGLTASTFPEVIAMSQKSSSMKGNPLPLTDKEVESLLEQAL